MRCCCFEIASASVFEKDKYPKGSKHEVQTRHAHSNELQFKTHWFRNHSEIVFDLCIDINSKMLVEFSGWDTLTYLFFALGVRGGGGRRGYFPLP